MITTSTPRHLRIFTHNNQPSTPVRKPASVYWGWKHKDYLLLVLRLPPATFATSWSYLVNLIEYLGMLKYCLCYSVLFDSDWIIFHVLLLAGLAQFSISCQTINFCQLIGLSVTKKIQVTDTVAKLRLMSFPQKKKQMLWLFLSQEQEATFEVIFRKLLNSINNYQCCTTVIATNV